MLIIAQTSQPYIPPGLHWLSYVIWIFGGITVVVTGTVSAKKAYDFFVKKYVEKKQTVYAVAGWTWAIWGQLNKIVSFLVLGAGANKHHVVWVSLGCWTLLLALWILVTTASLLTWFQARIYAKGELSDSLKEFNSEFKERADAFRAWIEEATKQFGDDPATAPLPEPSFAIRLRAEHLLASGRIGVMLGQISAAAVPPRKVVFRLLYDSFLFWMAIWVAI